MSQRPRSEIMKFFKYDHLPEGLNVISEAFCLLAETVEIGILPSAEKSTCLRKLLEAKDCAVRAHL